MRIEQHLERAARQWPSKTALVSQGIRTTYAGLHADAGRFAAVLVESGVRRGDRVVILSGNTREAVVAIYATLMAGATFCVLSPALPFDRLGNVLAKCAPSAIVVQSNNAITLRKALETTRLEPTLFMIGQQKAIENAIPFAEAVSRPRKKLPDPGIELDLAALIYTSGSTGEPKGVAMTHRNMDFASWSITSYLRNSSQDIILSALPISFNYGLYQVLMAVRVGATLVLEASYAFPQVILNRIDEEQVTGFPIVPTMSAVLMKQRDENPNTYPSLRYISNTAAELPQTHTVLLRRLFPNADIYSMYGLTECKRCTWLAPEELDQRPSSVGKAIPGTEVQVLCDDGTIAPPGVVGEIVVRGPHVMQGYWNDPEATAAVLKPGMHEGEKVLQTGDLGRTDEEGFLYLVGRKDDVIKTRGKKVCPQEIENVLYEIKGVREAVAVGVEDETLGHAIEAYLTLEDGAQVDSRSVFRYCSTRLEDFKLPRSVHFIDQMPVTTTGKILRRAVTGRPLII